MADLRIYPGYFFAPSYVGIWKDEHSLQFSVLFLIVLRIFKRKNNL